MAEFYDGTKLLSLQDLYGLKPEIYICTTNRSGGKTTYFSRYLVNKFKQGLGKFMLVYRYSYELDGCADKFFKDIKGLFFPNDNMAEKVRANGKYLELYLNDLPCGYAVALNDADQLKKLSHFFSDTNRMFMDEFMSENAHYCPREIVKFQSLHMSVARGQGEQARYVPMIMCANPVTMLNPYYEAFGISERLNNKVNFLKGDGFVLEQGYVESAYNAQMESGFNRAFRDKSYVAYGKEGVYLNDNMAFIEQPEGKGRYLSTLKFEGKEYAVREYAEDGIVYCDNRPDKTYPVKIAVTTDDHNINYVMLKQNDLFLSNLRYYFQRGSFRFKDLACKRAVLAALSA